MTQVEREWSKTSSALPSAPPEGSSLDNVTIWCGSPLAHSCRVRGWWREASANPIKSSKVRPAHILKSAADTRYRSRLCSHWEATQGSTCPMRRKGKCIFAHGPVELRVKESRRNKWGLRGAPSKEADAKESLRLSGGEDVLGAARFIEKIRAAESKKK